MKPTTDLEARVKEPESKILLVLAPYIKEGHVTKSKSGVWTVVRE